MKAKFQNWYYGEDGTNPFYRLKKAHKLFLLIFVGVTLFSFLVLDFDGVLTMQLFSTTSLFGFIVIFGFVGNFFGDNAIFIFSLSGHIFVLFVLALFGGCCLGWLITPLYLLLAIADIRYCIRAHKVNPTRRSEPKHKDLTK